MLPSVANIYPIVFFYFVQRLIALHVADTFVTVSFFCFVFFGVLFRISYSNWTQLVKKNCVFLCVFIFLFLLFGFHSMFHLFIFVVCLLVVVFFSVAHVIHKCYTYEWMCVSLSLHFFLSLKIVKKKPLCSITLSVPK